MVGASDPPRRVRQCGLSQRRGKKEAEERTLGEDEGEEKERKGGN